MKIVESEYWEDALRSCHVVEDCSSYINPEVADVNHAAAADQEVPLADVSHPAAADQEVPPADVSHPVSADQEAPPTDASHPVSANQEAPPEDNLKYVTKTTPMRELIKEMSGIVFALLESGL